MKNNPFTPPPSAFVYRPYPKSELALLYSPHSTPATALQQLYRWINYHPTLRSELHAMGYKKTRHTFLRNEVALIVHHLGEP
ncbi:MAG: DUF4248 domain-containing protein [Phocaeicola sp.]